MNPPLCICGCGQRAEQLHHVVYAQHIRAASIRLHPTMRELLRDKRNLVPVAHRCHGNHHAKARAYRLAVLPDSVFEFAAEVLGGPKAYEYLRRRYVGEDPRLDALLDGERREAA